MKLPTRRFWSVRSLIRSKSSTSTTQNSSWVLIQTKLPKDLDDEIIALPGKVRVEFKPAHRRALQVTAATIDASALTADDALVDTELDEVVDQEDNLSTL